MDTIRLAEELDKTASELEAMADVPVKKASEDTVNPYSSFLDGMVKHLGLE